MGARFFSPRFALLEVGVMFLPAIPAYLWVWPSLHGSQVNIFQAIVYLYVLGGTFLIGLRRWNWDQLGLNRKSILLTLACCLITMAARLLIILSIQWNVHPVALSPLRAIGDLIYYIFLVGLVEELLFRGLLYRIFEDWSGVERKRSTLAIWGSSAGFFLWHVFGQGLLVGLATFVIGLFFALIRRRAGGISGLIVLHALWDLETVWLVSDSSAEVVNLKNFQPTHPALMWLGTLLLFLVPVYLLWIHPRLVRS
jgi:membrane protease YdiL (CAAX protease family)